MRCVEFEGRLQRLLDERRDPTGDQELFQHTLECDDCESMLRGQQLLTAGLSYGFRPSAETIPLQVVDAYCVSLTERRKRRVRWTAGSLAISLTACLVMFGQGTNSVPSGEFPPAAGVATPGSPATASLPAEPPAVMEQDAEYADLFGSLLAQLDTAQLGRLSAVDQIANGFRPLAETFTVALGALKQTLPSGAHAAEPPDSAHLGVSRDIS